MFLVLWHIRCLPTLPFITLLACNVCIPHICLYFSIQQFIYLKRRNKDYVVRGCSYKGELARLDGLARLGEISSTLKNSVL